MNKKLKKLFSLFLALTMILTAIPLSSLSVFADDTVNQKNLPTLTWGACAYGKNNSGTDTRWDSSGWTTAVSDVQQGGKFSFTVWTYDLSAIPKNSEIQSATISGSIEYVDANHAGRYLDFYWIPQGNIPSDDLAILSLPSTGGQTSATAKFMDESATNSGVENSYQKVKDYYNLTDSNLFGSAIRESSKTQNFSMNLATALTKAKNAGSTKFVVIAMQRTPADSSFWSDAKITSIPTVSVNYKDIPIDTTINRVNDENAVTGRVTVDNVIYTSSDADTKNYGQYISQTAPYYTPITVKSGTSIKTIELVDSDETLTTTTVNGKTVLAKQIMNDEKFNVGTDKNVSATLKFTFTDGKVEYHRVAVKTVPVEAHIALTTQESNGAWINPTYYETSYETYFAESYGSITGDGKGNDTRTGNWLYHRNIPNGSTNQATNQKKAYESLNQNDKIAGFGEFADGDNVTTTTIPTARYYIDTSNTNLANGNLWQNGGYTISIPNVRWIRYTSLCRGTASISNQNSSLNLNMPTSSFAHATTNGTTYTITYSGNSSVNADASQTNFVVRLYNTNHYIEPKANLSINVFSKATTRNAYNEAIANTKYNDENQWTATSYAAYLNALLEAEAYLSNFEDTTNESSTSAYKTAIENAKNNLVPRGDVQKIIDARDEAAKNLTNANYTTSSRNELQNILNSLNYINTTADERRDISVADVEAELAKIKDVLDPVADFTELLAAFKKADELLTNLDGKEAVYTNNAVKALTDALAAAKYMAFEVDKADTGTKNGQQTQIDNLRDAINNAYDALTTNKPSVDLSAYEAIKETLARVDIDVFDLTEEDKAKLTEIVNKIRGTVSYTNLADTTINVSVFPDDLDINTVDVIVSEFLTELNLHRQVYDITVSDNVTSNLASYNNVSYGTSATFSTGNEDTAWYMTYDSKTTNRSLQYQTTGADFTMNIFGALNIEAHTRNDLTPYKVTITRNYTGTNQSPALELIDFVGADYTLPEAKAVANYKFTGYTVNGESKNANDVITLTADTKITANYEYTGEDYVITIDGQADNYKYNDKIQLNADEGKVWLQNTAAEGQPAQYRMFYNGPSTTLYVIGSMELISVAEADLDNYNLSNPVYLRQEGTMTAEGKVVFNGQIAAPQGATVKEFGVLVGKAKDGNTITAADVILENSGNNDAYKLLRCKSTKTYGANQFTIRVGGLSLENNDVIYKGYIIYENEKNEIVTVYTDAMYN